MALERLQTVTRYTPVDDRRLRVFAVPCRTRRGHRLPCTRSAGRVLQHVGEYLSNCVTSYRRR